MKTGISDTKRFVFDVTVREPAVYIKIEGKLPDQVQTVTGVYFSIAHTANLRGMVSLRFSEGISNPLLHQPVKVVGAKRKKEKYIPLHEAVTHTSTMQGFYRDQSGGDFTPYVLKIYIEYIPRETKKNCAK